MGIARYAVMGTMVLPNIMYRWYRWLDSFIPSAAPSSIIKKLVLDQCLMAPPTLAIFYTGMSILEGKQDITKECRQKLPHLDCWILILATGAGSQLPAGPPSGSAVVRQLLLLALGQHAVHYQEKS